MKLIYKSSLIIGLFFIISSCGGGSDSDIDPGPDNTNLTPQAADLVFPENNTECNEGVTVSETTSRVTFKWSDAENTDSYEVNIKNLNTNTSTKVISDTNQADIVIDRGTPYQWFVISSSESSNIKARSPIAKFYNQGEGVKNYAPFPADVVIPERGASITGVSTVRLEWEGSDVDNDIKEYEIFIGTDKASLASIGKTGETFMNTDVTANTYYWQVATHDDADNSSESEIFEFKIN
ncbi:fibronectin type III domain-containing protein [Flavivirga eckloniae]|uniref:Fibronectin type-III domain-containing protein n=1 Tax=Flavivirga eckloniae TaxID=1803846 RepID=A0A2K9PN89_9FLAO|nr:hypothetical protein [Flavivirga eckloniae]AUP78519.1 hypothetical protein C1H87_07265 [Flavivirga eckloniae]